MGGLAPRIHVWMKSTVALAKRGETKAHALLGERIEGGFDVLLGRRLRDLERSVEVPVRGP